MSYTDFDFPHTNMYESDLREILAQMDKLKEIVNNFVNVEKVTFADPILWNITTQYSKNTIVLSVSGDAYLSKVAVPAGVQLNNEGYWQEIFNFADYVRTANENLTINVEQNTTRSTHPYHVDDWLLWNDVLYKVIAEIAVDDLLVVDTNVEHFTVEDFIKAWIAYANGIIQQYKNDIDASELAYRQQLAQDIATTTASLQAQLNLAISGATVDSEVINARLGADGVTYSTLGEAIRTQVSDIDYTMAAITKSVIKRYTPSVHGNLFDKNTVGPIHYYWNYQTGKIASTTMNVYAADLIPVKPSTTYTIVANHVIQQGCFFTADGTFISGFTGDNVATYEITTPSNCYLIGMTIPNSQINVYGLYEGTVRTKFSPFNGDSADYDYLAENNKYIFDVIEQNYAPAKSVNLFDNTKISERGYYWNYQTGEKATTTYNLYAADPIPVKPNTAYKIVASGNIGQIAFFDEYMGFIEGNAGGNISTLSFTTHGDCYYIGISVQGSQLTLTALYEDTTLTSYKKYQKKLTYDILPDPVIVASSGGDYTSILNALKSTPSYIPIRIKAGAYDIVQEYLDYYGATFWDDYDGYSGVADKFYRGLWLDNNRKLFFDANARISFNYTGDTQKVKTSFSPFATCGNCEIHGLNLSFSNCRYAIHDDFFEFDGTEVFADCIFDGQSNNGDTIGAGLGRSNLILIKNCLFLNNNSTAGGDISYHNNAYTSNSRSKIIVKDCYGTNTVKFKWYGTNTEVSECIACGNQFKSIECLAHTVTPNTTVNMHLTKWNNIETN